MIRIFAREVSMSYRCPSCRFWHGQDVSSCADCGMSKADATALGLLRKRRTSYAWTGPLPGSAALLLSAVAKSSSLTVAPTFVGLGAVTAFGSSAGVQTGLLCVLGAAAAGLLIGVWRWVVSRREEYGVSMSAGLVALAIAMFTLAPGLLSGLAAAAIGAVFGCIIGFGLLIKVERVGHWATRTYREAVETEIRGLELLATARSAPGLRSYEDQIEKRLRKVDWVNDEASKMTPGLAVTTAGGAAMAQLLKQGEEAKSRLQAAADSISVVRWFNRFEATASDWRNSNYSGCQTKTKALEELESEGAGLLAEIATGSDAYDRLASALPGVRDVLKGLRERQAALLAANINPIEDELELGERISEALLQSEDMVPAPMKLSGDLLLEDELRRIAAEVEAIDEVSRAVR
jgi:hypothetical protein